MGFLTGPLVPAPESSHRAWIGQRFSYPIASLLPSHIRYATSVDRPIAQVTSGLSRGVSPWRTRDTKTASARDQPPSSRRNEGAAADHFIRGRRWRRPRPGRPPGRPCRTRRRRWSCGRSRPGRHTAIPLAQVPDIERGRVGVQVGTDPGDLGLGDPQRGDQVVNLAGQHAVRAGLRHHGVQPDIGAHHIRINGTHYKVGNNRPTAGCARQSSSNSRMAT
jgi:hypothetical protein